MTTDAFPRQTASDFGARLRMIREAKDWSMQDLSSATGVSKAYIVRMETGRPKPANVTLAMVERLAEELRVSPAWLAFGRDDVR